MNGHTYLIQHKADVKDWHECHSQQWEKPTNVLTYEEERERSEYKINMENESYWFTDLIEP